MYSKNQEKSRSQPFLSRHATLVSSSLPDETKPDAFFLQTVPDSIIFEIPQTYLNIQREQTEMKTQFEIEKYVLRKKYYRWLLPPRLLFLSCYFSSASKTVKYDYFGINIIFLDWIIWRADYNISRPRTFPLYRIIRIINIIKVAPQLLGINMKICYDPCFIDIRVTMAT